MHRCPGRDVGAPPPVHHLASTWQGQLSRLVKLTRVKVQSCFGGLQMVVRAQWLIYIYIYTYIYANPPPLNYREVPRYRRQSSYVWASGV